MNGLKKSGWKYWNYFQAINPGASAKGRHTFSALRTVPDDDLGMPSDDLGVTTTSSVTTATSVMTSTSHLRPHHSLMNVDNATADSGNKRRLSITSLSSESGVEPVPASSTVVSNSSGLRPKKAAKSVIGSMAFSSPSQTSKPSSHVSKSASQFVSPPTQKAAKISQAVAFTELKHLMVGLLDTIRVTPEDSVAKSRREMTSFIHKDNFLLPAQKMHCIKLFIDNVAYANCLRGFVGELTDPNGPNAMDEQLDGIHSYYSTLLDISI